MTSAQAFDYAIIGGGAAGTLLAIRLLHGARAGARIAMIEPGDAGRGVAYGSDNPAHVLNVPAGSMSAFAESPDDFVDFLRQRDGGAEAGAFMPRRDYAAYLARRLDEARGLSRAEFVHQRARVLCIEPYDDDMALLLDDGTQLKARRLALASGNQPRGCAFDADGAGRVLSGWDHAQLENIGADDAVVIIGSGLSMVDVVLGLQARAHCGQLTVVSRHGLLPLPHASKKQALAVDVEALYALDLRRQLRRLREIATHADAQGIGWQALLDALRHHVRALWQSLSIADQRRFLRHAVRHWDVHRHRIPAEVAMQLHAMRDTGRLRLIAGRVCDAQDGGDALTVTVLDRHDEARTLSAHWLVNATGIETRAAHFSTPLLQSMLQRGQARPGPHGLGFDTDDNGALIDAAGRAQPRVAALGSLRLGNLWETTAVPDLRVDAAQLAERWRAAQDQENRNAGKRG